MYSGMLLMHFIQVGEKNCQKMPLFISRKEECNRERKDLLTTGENEKEKED